MNNLSLEIDTNYIDEELREYLLTLKGISDIKINDSKNIIDVEYDNNIISINILKLEISLFLNRLKIPFILSFNKHPKIKTTNYQMVIKDLCCERCLEHIIEELFLTTGIESAFSDFDFSNFNYINQKNIKINIKYNPFLISKEKILKLEDQFNF